MSEHLSLLIHHNDIEQTVSRIASRISEDYKGRPLLVVGILKGAFIFMADLVRQISIPIEIDFVTVSSYGSGTESSRRIRLMQDMTTQVKDKDVLLVAAKIVGDVHLERRPPPGMVAHAPAVDVDVAAVAHCVEVEDLRRLRPHVGRNVQNLAIVGRPPAARTAEVRDGDVFPLSLS